MEIKNYYLPAEWHPQSYIQLTWPHKDTDWAYMLEEVEKCFLEIATHIAQRQPLLLVAPQFPAVLENFAYRDNICYIPCPTNDTWARDHGFITLLQNESAPLLLDFCFNGWGMKFAANKDNLINSELIKADCLRVIMSIAATSFWKADPSKATDAELCLPPPPAYWLPTETIRWTVHSWKII